MSLDDFPRVPLMFGPSPIHPLERLTEHLGGARLWAKRDDCNSGIAFGGNKTRKLEYLAADALAQGCDTLVSIGGVQSNHTRQVAAVAARLGLRCVLVQESWVDWPDVTYDRVGNILISRLCGAEVRLVTGRLRDRLQGVVGAGAARRRGARRHAVRDPGGRLRPPARRPRLRGLGARGGRAGAVLGVEFDTIVVCSVTGSTQAGMVAGFALEGKGRRVHRHRRLREAHRDARAGAADRARHGRARSASSAS